MQKQLARLVEYRIDELLLGVNVHLPVDVLNMGLGSVLGDSQLVFNDNCGVTESEVLEYFLFTRRERMSLRAKLAPSLDVQARIPRQSRTESGQSQDGSGKIGAFCNDDDITCKEKDNCGDDEECEGVIRLFLQEGEKEIPQRGTDCRAGVNEAVVYKGGPQRI